MPGETGYITLSEVDSNSTSEWCESGSDTTWENQQEPAPGLNSLSSNLKAPPFVPSPSSVPSAALPSSFVPSPRHKGSMQGSMNDQDKYPDLPDYMPYMPRCVPHASPSTPARHALSDRSIGFTVDQMNAFHQQQNGSHRYLYPGGHYPFQRFSGAGAFQQAEHEFTTDRSQGTGMGLQKGKHNSTDKTKTAQEAACLHLLSSHAIIAGTVCSLQRDWPVLLAGYSPIWGNWQLAAAAPALANFTLPPPFPKKCS